jgi:hypothetical protein
MMNRKNNKLAFFLILIFLLSSGWQDGISKAKVLKPQNAGAKISLLISGKKVAYYTLPFTEPAVITVKGPGKLKIISRGLLSSPERKKLNYTVFYRINGAEKVKVDFNNIQPDAKAKFEEASHGYPSKGENIIIELSRGEHTIEFWSNRDNSQICSRFLFTETREKKIDWISLSPAYPNEPVSLVTNEDIVSYYRYSSSKPLIIRITGPTVVRVLNRIEFDFRMKGRVNYRIQVSEDKKVKNTYMLGSVRSDVTGYKKTGKKTPGKANEIVISVPAGRHTYEIISLDKHTILARILFPKKDIKLGR